MWKTACISGDYTVTDTKSDMFTWLIKFNADKYIAGAERNRE